VANEEGVVSIDLPLQVDEALQWLARIKTLSAKPLRVIIFTAPDRVNSDALKALAPHLGAFSLPAIIQDAGFNQLYAALEASQPRLLEPLSPVQLRERAVLPDMTFSDAATFTLGMSNPVRIDIASAGGYGAGGSSVSIRDTGILFAGWMVSSDQPPWAPGAQVDAWIARLTALRRNRKVKLIVPAAGPVGDLSMATRTQDYLKAASAAVKKLVRQHKPRESLGALAQELAAFYKPNQGSKDAAGLLAARVAERVEQSLGRMYDELMAAQTTSEIVPEP
jgi:hypothetical protein